VTDPLVAASRAAIARGSKSFALASRLFDRVTRDRATLLYAWCRYADDVIDGQVDGFGRVEAVGTSDERLAALDAGTRAALAGAGGNTFAFAALARVAAETAMPPRYPLDLIEGFRSDVEKRRFLTFDDTLSYCYHVAGCVGVMMAIVMGVDPDDGPTLDRACDLGLAFQLDNIARDVIEDAANARCYLPEDWLAGAGLTLATFAAPHKRVALATVVARLVDEAERYAASSRYGTPKLPWRSAWAVLAAADIYGGIGRRVRAEGAAALDRRVTTSSGEKVAAIARALPAMLTRRQQWAMAPSRAELWTRPSLP
jgi:phytoene synthase